MANLPPDGTEPWGLLAPPASEEGRTWSDPAEAQASRLAAEMAASWQRGDRPRAEEYLGRHPRLAEHPEAAIRLIYEEICLRRDIGEDVSSHEVLNRFPRWRPALEVLLDCDRLIRPQATAPEFPKAGESLGDFRLLAELGRGALGRTFLASQPALADRPIVVKVTPLDHEEHLSLARLQHTNIAPLYSVQEFPERGLRSICMPYLGGVTLAKLLDALWTQPLAGRTGRDLLATLDEAQAAIPVPLPARGPAREFLARSTYVAAACWIGAHLADALDYAHERGLIHMDVKPSNVLLAAEGQPLLLDFHLAREPLRPNAGAAGPLGGTFGYMAPEHRKALVEVAKDHAITSTVDGRADLFSLGLILYEMLSGCEPSPGLRNRPRLDRCNPGVSVGLADVVHKCLRPEVEGRYPTAAALAADLRRHLADLPLTGVPNRSLTERWRKWRRRTPYALSLIFIRLILMAALIAGAGLVAGVTSQYARTRRTAEAALAEGRALLTEPDPAGALQVLTVGLAQAEGLPGGRELRRALVEQVAAARRAQDAVDLHALAERVRSLAGADSPPRGTPARTLERLIDVSWGRRQQYLFSLSPEAERRVRYDLLDLAIIGADLHARDAPPERSSDARRESLHRLDEAEALLGPSPALDRQRQGLAEALGLTELARTAARRAAEQTPRTAWEHYTLGRSLQQAGDLPGALSELEQAAELQPDGFWPHFALASCAHHLGRYEDAVHALGVCLALAPGNAECYYNRALAFSALGRDNQSLRDYDRALRHDPGLAPAALNRGILRHKQGHDGEALADFESALNHGADPAVIHYNISLVHFARGDRAGALKSLEHALTSDPSHQAAREFRDRLRRGRGTAILPGSR